MVGGGCAGGEGFLEGVCPCVYEGTLGGGGLFGGLCARLALYPLSVQGTLKLKRRLTRTAASHDHRLLHTKQHKCLEATPLFFLFLDATQHMCHITIFCALG
jgi:hypothetical protein